MQSIQSNNRSKTRPIKEISVRFRCHAYFAIWSSRRTEREDAPVDWRPRNDAVRPTCWIPAASWLLRTRPKSPGPLPRQWRPLWYRGTCPSTAPNAPRDHGHWTWRRPGWCGKCRHPWCPPLRRMSCRRALWQTQSLFWEIWWCWKTGYRAWTSSISFTVSPGFQCMQAIS